MRDEKNSIFFTIRSQKTGGIAALFELAAVMPQIKLERKTILHLLLPPRQPLPTYTYNFLQTKMNLWVSRSRQENKNIFPFIHPSFSFTKSELSMKYKISWFSRLDNVTIDPPDTDCLHPFYQIGLSRVDL